MPETREVIKERERERKEVDEGLGEGKEQKEGKGKMPRNDMGASNGPWCQPRELLMVKLEPAE